MRNLDLALDLALDLGRGIVEREGDEALARRRLEILQPTLVARVEAHDEHERIARGMHKLRVIDCDRLAARVRAKQG